MKKDGFVLGIIGLVVIGTLYFLKKPSLTPETITRTQVEKLLEKVPLPQRAALLPESDIRDPVERAFHAYTQLANSRYVLKTENDATFSADGFDINRLARLKNYAEIDALKTTTDESGRKRFIDFFKQTTGFPNLSAVSERMRTYFDAIVADTARELNQKTGDKGLFDVLFTGFDLSCSAGINTALPGSDLDKSFIFIRGSGDTETDVVIAREFGKALYLKTDQRIISYNSDIYNFPAIITVAQYTKMLDTTDARTETFLTPQLRISYERAKNDISRANIMELAQFNRDLAKHLNKQEKDAVFDFAHFIEIFSGEDYFEHPENHSLSPLQKNLIARCKESPFCAYSNIYEIRRFYDERRRGVYKRKHYRRLELEKVFDRLSVDDQFALISELIKNISGDSTAALLKPFIENDVMITRKLLPLEAELLDLPLTLQK